MNEQENSKQEKERNSNSLILREKGELQTREGIVSHSVAKNLIRDAMEAMKKSYAPYSHFQVGAALMAKNKKVYKGCNIENAAYGATNCAERTALFKAVSEGERDFSAIAVVGGKNGLITEFCPPCGVCRQVLREFTDPKNFLVILARSEEDYVVFLLEELLPLSFGPENL